MNNIPKHVAIILDGNRRWARERGLPTIVGHKKAVETSKKIIRYLRKQGVHTVTLWAFSTENWDRTKEEIGYLMILFEKAVEDNLREAEADEIRIVHIGRKDRLPTNLLKKIAVAEERTKMFTKHILNIALDYGGRDEILRAAKKITAKQKINGNLNNDMFLHNLDTNGQPYPEPDVIIRTGGEQRLSGFMLWQAAYSELFFVKKGFPAFTTNDVDMILGEFKTRQRRFGK